MRRSAYFLTVLTLVLPLAGCGASQSAANDVNAAIGMIDRADLTVGAANLQQWREAHGTYAGATPGVSGVTLVRADANTWCLQTANAHEVGPVGTAAAGPC